MKNKEPESSPLPSKVEKQFEIEIDHIFDSGANPIRIKELFHRFLQRKVYSNAEEALKPYSFKEGKERRIYFENAVKGAEEYAAQFKSPDSPLNPSEPDTEELFQSVLSAFPKLLNPLYRRLKQHLESDEQARKEIISNQMADEVAKDVRGILSNSNLDWMRDYNSLVHLVSDHFNGSSGDTATLYDIEKFLRAYFHPMQSRIKYLEAKLKSVAPLNPSGVDLEERDRFAIEFADYMRSESWEYDFGEEVMHTSKEHLEYFKQKYN